MSETLTSAEPVIVDDAPKTSAVDAAIAALYAELNDAKSDHLSVHDIRQHGPEPLAFAALNFIESHVAGPALHARAIPLGEERFFRAVGLAPAHAMPHCRVTRGHRLAVDTDLLPQAPSDPSLRIGELDALRSDPAVPTGDASLPIDECDVMRAPRQVVPRAIPTRAHARRASATSAAGVPSHAASLNPNHQAAALSFVHRRHAKSRQTENPRTIASRSHPSSLVGCTSRENTIRFRMAKWDCASDRVVRVRIVDRPSTP